MKRGKKYVDAAKLIDRATLYDAAEAISLVKKSAVANFDETVEAHVRLGVDGRHADQQVRGAVVLPHGTGKTVKVLVFAKGDKVAEAEAAGADYVGGEELVPKIQNDGWCNSRHDGCCWSFRTCTWTKRLNAKPKSWYCYHGCNKGC